ncbi:MAG: hypothetical protein KA998_03920, partial [Rickettsiaceae bacterium]|nr:hypothetical protein [Rickettsiaceae bacterium]
MPTAPNDKDKNALYQAIRNNNIEEVKSLYDSHPDWIPQYQEGSNESPMPVGFREIFRHGTFSQNLEMVQYIIEKMGPNLVTAVTTNGQTALHLSKNVEVMKLIINKIATLGGNVEEYVNKIDRFGKTALYDATETEEVEILRKNGANPFIGKSPLLYDSSPQRTKGALNGMFSYLSIEDQTRLANKDRPILHTQRMDVLKCLIKKGAKIETAEEFTSIIENSRTEHSALNMTKFLLPLASKLLENKPEDIKNIHDYILLKYTNNPEVSRILFNSFNKYNLDINAPEINGNPPPHLAREDNIKTALIDREADIFAENNEGLRPTPPEHLYFDPSSQRISDRNQN